MPLFRTARWLLLALLISVIPASSHAQIVISVGFAPPVLPVYEQPYCPQPNLMWVPGYWAYGDGDFYWVPGAWVPAPYDGALWTPYYWDWYGGRYRFHRGYWGRHVGYYGGVDYGFGYGGIGFTGGEWRGNQFAYNTAVMRVNQSVIHTTYSDPAIVQRNTISNPSRVSYNGGPGGIQHAATSEERVAERDQHTAPTRLQAQHEGTAKADKTSYAKANGGHPQNAAAAKPLGEPTHAAPTGPKTEAKPEARTAPKPETRTAPKTETRTALKTEARTAPRTETRTAPKTEARTAPKPETRTAPKPETRTEPKPEARTAPKTETRTEPRTETRTAPAQHPAPQQHSAPQEHAAPQQHSAPAQHPAPQQHSAPQEHAAPQQHSAPAQHAAPQEESKPKG